jgi:hypothetical protein
MGIYVSLQKNIKPSFMSKPILIVPDVHGRDFWEPAEDFDGEVIFLGDYVDPYPSEKISPAEAFETFGKIIDFKRRNPERVTLLAGNHELHYYDMQYRCTRFSYNYFAPINEILTGAETQSWFKVCRKAGGVIFTHAGILKGWHKRYADRLEKLGETIDEQLNNLFAISKGPFNEVSNLYRGGIHHHGSPLWADYNEIYYETESYEPDCIQVIGHTRIADPLAVVCRNIRLVDNRRLHLLDNGDVRPYEP